MRSPNRVLESLKSKACISDYSYERLYRNDCARWIWAHDGRKGLLSQMGNFAGQAAILGGI